MEWILWVMNCYLVSEALAEARDLCLAFKLLLILPSLMRKPLKNISQTLNFFVCDLANLSVEKPCISLGASFSLHYRSGLLEVAMRVPTILSILTDRLC